MPLSNVRWWNRLAVILPAAIALGTLLLVARLPCCSSRRRSGTC